MLKWKPLLLGVYRGIGTIAPVVVPVVASLLEKGAVSSSTLIGPQSRFGDVHLELLVWIVRKTGLRVLKGFTYFVLPCKLSLGVLFSVNIFWLGEKWRLIYVLYRPGRGGRVIYILNSWRRKESIKKKLSCVFLHTTLSRTIKTF